MDDKMIERCVAAAKAKRFELINAPLERCYEDIIIAVVKAMREPTQNMLEAGYFINTAQSGVYGCDDVWDRMIEAIIND